MLYKQKIGTDVMGLRSLFRKMQGKTKKNPRPSLNELDKKLEKYLSFQNGFFIEAGANDGYAQSNTYYLENSLGWSGILVEGIPELYAKCKKLRKSSSVYNCALVSDDFIGETVTMHYANLMSVVEGSLKTAEAQTAHIEAGLNVQRIGSSYTTEVPAKTLTSIFDQQPNLPTIDFFSLDVEGYELDVLKGLDLARYRPRFILVEARFFSEVDKYLRSQRYTMLEKLSVHDYLYIDGNVASRSAPIQSN